VTGNARRPPSGQGRKSQSRTERRRARVDQRRRHAAAHATWVTKRRRRTAGLAGAAILLVAGGLAAVLVVQGHGSGSGSQDLSLHSELVQAAADATSSTAATPAGITPPAAYHVTYRVDSYDSGKPVSTDTEDFQVSRPYDAAVQGKAGAPPGTSQQWRSVSNLGLYWDTSNGGDPEVYHVLPQTALGDLRLDATLDDLVTQKLFVPRERRQVLGRECQVYRTGAPLETFSVAKATATDYADACIDRSGLLLEEVAVVGGKLDSRMLATSVDAAARPSAATFAIKGTPTALADGGVELTTLDAGRAPAAGYWDLAAPAGYRHVGRYRIRVQDNPPADSTGTTTTTTAPAEPKILVSYADVYTKGIDTIVVQQGPTASEQAPETTAPVGPPATLGALGKVEVRTGLTGSTLYGHAGTDRSWFVHVAGSSPASELEALTRPIHVTS